MQTGCKNSNHIRLLDQRLKSWKDGDLPFLISECRTRFGLQRPTVSVNQTSRSFLFEGKTKAALDVVSSGGHSRILNLDDVVDLDSTSSVVLDVLKSKHPPAQPLYMDCTLLNGKILHLLFLTL